MTHLIQIVGIFTSEETWEQGKLAIKATTGDPPGISSTSLRPPREVCEAHLLQAYKPFVIGAISTSK